MKLWWESLEARARFALAAATASLLIALAGAGWWVLRPEPAVLFSELRPQDAAAIGAELDKLKIAYEVADGGATLLVERSQVPAVRMKLMARELPLHGTVGLELFNTTDFGMTEFAQKVNFQRALQGELTRTILSFPEIRDARVHLVLPEQGLFKQNAARAKAAITLALRPGHVLRPEQVNGMQRLVAAAVPGLSAQEVTIVDQQGAPLTRMTDAEGEGVASGTRLELKRETESYLAHKATAVLDQAFGPGEALASVDVTLNMDQVRVTTEDVIPAADGKGGQATGVLVRERESARDGGATDPRNLEARGPRGSSLQRDVEYQAGRRVENVVSQPGSIRRIHLVAVVRKPLSNEQVSGLERLLAAAVGATPERGDSVVVQTLAVQPAVVAGTSAATPAVSARAPAPDLRWAWGLAGGVAALGLVFALVVLRSLRARVPPRSLSDAQRQATLQRVQVWLLEAETVTAGAAAPARGQE
jgi:flagellar M-ring protein FliF